MMDAGIERRIIFPVRFPWILSNWNYRDHCKIVTIDGKESFTGVQRSLTEHIIEQSARLLSPLL